MKSHHCAELTERNALHDRIDFNGSEDWQDGRISGLFAHVDGLPETVTEKMLTQLADMLAEREKAEPVYQRRHVDSHTWVDCSPEEHKIWNENNRRILYTHPAAQESGR